VNASSWSLDSATIFCPHCEVKEWLSVIVKDVLCLLVLFSCTVVYLPGSFLRSL
jgi:hypothetical protein